eukprot:TRINITY_DN761_c0_g1_i4.p1 TRINITY_DN761_c0_g1~~TRINITY_DN761_c0_g1_i4.p1  ORF type:complete len:479 (+),score=171.89 TRINITY_DN761_c0_g1_i4:135-1439(+)
MEDVSDLQREGIVTSDFTCQKCQCQDFKLERDILDVWFVSGLSKCIVLPDSEVDVYLEGKDQHRGWFSSSLLCSSVLEKNCTKSFLTHGFCYDNNGEKISKSSTLNVKSKMSTTLLNVNQAMEYRSADVLRLWAASIPFQGDISHSDFVMRTVRHDYMKIRKTFRTLLGHLYDFSPADLIPISQLLHLDQFTLQTLHNFYVKVVKCYNSWDFSTATKLIISYLKEDLRCFFLDAGKFRLYHSKPRSFERRSAQSCVWIILETMVHLLAPILSFLVEEVWECLGTDSIHLHQFVAPPNVFLETCQSDVKKASEKHKLVSTLEKMRNFVGREAAKKDIGHLGNLFRAKIVISIQKGSDCHGVMQQLVDEVAHIEEFLLEYFTVSGCQIAWVDEMTEAWKIEVESADGIECQRCWRFASQDEMKEGICSRCHSIVFE